MHQTPSRYPLYMLAIRALLNDTVLCGVKYYGAEGSGEVSLSLMRSFNACVGVRVGVGGCNIWGGEWRGRSHN